MNESNLKAHKGKEEVRDLLERIGIPETLEFLNKLNKSGKAPSSPIIIREGSKALIRVKDGVVQVNKGGVKYVPSIGLPPKQKVERKEQYSDILNTQVSMGTKGGLYELVQGETQEKTNEDYII